LGGGFRLEWACAAAVLILARPGFAQTALRLGPVDLSMAAHGEVGYDSNVDDAYPEDEKSGVQKGDFYWMPSLTLNTRPASMRPGNDLSLSAEIGYKDYFARNDLDEELKDLYNVTLNFHTTVGTRLTLGGLASTEYSVESQEDTYYTGGKRRSPSMKMRGEGFANWEYRKFRLESKVSHERIRYDLASFQKGDQDETILHAGAFWDLYSWGGLFYTWERTITTLIQTDETKDETISTFGLTGAIPVNILRHPKISYAFGAAYEDKKSDTGEDEKKWEPTHTLTAEDEYQLTKTIRLTGNATWASKVADDDISFIYNINLSQQLGPRAQHALTFSQEPEATFGSTSDTKTTDFGYLFSLKDLFFYNLNLTAGADYKESTPLGEADALTEKTTKLNFGLNHTRQLSRKLSRTIVYEYTSENSNFHSEGPNQKHLLSYAFIYNF
jgi:hypothetical protein